MKNTLKTKCLVLVTTFALLVSLFVPSLASAYTILGDQANPKLTIYKYAQEPSGINGNTPPEIFALPSGNSGTGLPGETPSGTLLEGVEFTLTQTHSYNPNTNEWTEVTGATPLVGVTDANGQIVFTQADGLELGRYQVEETDGPASVILNKTVYSVDIPMTSPDGTTLNYDVHIYPKNEVVRGDAELIKKGEDGSLLPGVVFGLYNADETLVTQLTTDANGKVVAENLEAGQYYFQEIQSVDGYLINNAKIEFEVTQDEQGSIVTWIDGAINTGNEVINYNVPEIVKDVEGQDVYAVDRDKEYTYNIAVQTPGDITSYKALGIRDVLDDRLTYVANSWTVTGTDASNIKFTQDGQTLVWEVIDLTQLTPNQEVKVSFKAKIKPDAVLEATETGIPNTASVHFDNNGGSFTEPANPNDPTDPENPPTEEPPSTPPVEVVPTEGGLKVIKVDKADNTIRLQGAEFKLTTDEEGNNVVDATGTVIRVNGEIFTGLLENLATDMNGEILIDGLTPGTYYLHETKAPIYTDENGETKAYRLLTAPLQVTVQDSVDSSEVTVENSKSGWQLPTTGGMGTTLFTIAGLVLMTLAAFIALRRKRQEETV